MSIWIVALRSAFSVPLRNEGTGRESICPIAMYISTTRKAIERKSGARALRSIFEECLMDAMYTVPSDNTITKVIINGDTVATGKTEYEHGDVQKRYKDNTIS